MANALMSIPASPSSQTIASPASTVGPNRCCKWSAGDERVQNAVGHAQACAWGRANRRKKTGQIQQRTPRAQSLSSVAHPSHVPCVGMSDCSTTGTAQAWTWPQNRRVKICANTDENTVRAMFSPSRASVTTYRGYPPPWGLHAVERRLCAQGWPYAQEQRRERARAWEQRTSRAWPAGARRPGTPWKLCWCCLHNTEGAAVSL